MSNDLEPRVVRSIVEGCLPDTVLSLLYFRSHREIPLNSRLVKLGPLYFSLYGKTKDFESFERERSFSASKNGWPLEELAKEINFILDCPRSIVTRDGRIYICSNYVDKVFEGYINLLPQVLYDCKNLYSQPAQ